MGDIEVKYHPERSWIDGRWVARFPYKYTQVYYGHVTDREHMGVAGFTRDAAIRRAQRRQRQLEKKPLPPFPTLEDGKDGWEEL